VDPEEGGAGDQDDRAGLAPAQMVDLAQHQMVD
jgi:hypothetical protein